MSATFKNSKKKLMQTELRRLMNEHKSKKDVKPVDSPLAKYNENGELTCILCKSVVRSAGVWPVHINSKQHKENIELAKKLKERTSNFTKPAKRPVSPVQSDIPQKKLKGILKKPGSSAINEEIVNDSHESMVVVTNEQLPTDFFDSKVGNKGVVKDKVKGHSSRSEANHNGELKEEKDVIPEGFFDDPKLDAKARNQEYKDPIEEEWEKFQKAIKEADDESAAIIAEDQDEATTERQIDEIDEQMKHLSKVLVLEKKKKEIAIASGSKNNENDEDSDVDEGEFDEFLDWRSKTSFK